MIPPRKVTLNLDGPEYDKLQRSLYHGQMTRMFKRFIESVNLKILYEGKAEFNSWLEGERGIYLPTLEELDPTFIEEDK